MPSHESFGPVFWCARSGSFRASLLELYGGIRPDQRDQVRWRGGGRWQSSSRVLRTQPQRHVTSYGQCLRERARMALATCEAPSRNETKGALEFLQHAFARSCIVTADVLRRNRRFARKVLDRGARNVLAFKEIRANYSRMPSAALPARASVAWRNGSSQVHTIDPKPGAPHPSAGDQSQTASKRFRK